MEKAEIAQEKKRCYEELGRIPLQYRLNIVNEARSPKKIMEHAIDGKGCVKFCAVGGGFLLDKSSASSAMRQNRLLVPYG